jgi:glutaredoxin
MSKPDCPRCAQIAEAVRKVIRVPVLIEVIDITKDQDLLEQYRNDIPVILIDGIERFRQTIDPQKLLQFLSDEPGQRTLGYTS